MWFTHRCSPVCRAAQTPSPRSKPDTRTGTWATSTYLVSRIQYKRAYVEMWVRRGYSSLSLRTKSLYICTYVVLKSYTFGLSGAGPGSFTWDPVPNERTSNPRLLQRWKRTRQEITTSGVNIGQKKPWEHRIQSSSFKVSILKYKGAQWSQIFKSSKTTN